MDQAAAPAAWENGLDRLGRLHAAVSAAADATALVATAAGVILDATNASLVSVRRWDIEEGLVRTLVNVTAKSTIRPTDETYLASQFPSSTITLIDRQFFVSTVDGLEEVVRSSQLQAISARLGLAAPIVVEGSLWG